MLRELLYGLVGIVLLAYTLELTSALFDDPREPPRVSSRIPVIGNVLGLLRHGTKHYIATSKQTSAEIYTLSFVFVKVYVANTQRLTPLIQRSAKTLSFRPFIQTMSKVMADSSDETHALFGGELVDRFSTGMRTALTPGPWLDGQNLRMGRRALAGVDELVAGQEKNGEIALLGWVRRMVVQASSCGVFGEQHPFVDPKVEQAYWKWTEYHPQHIAHMDFFRVGYAARDIVFDAFRTYCRSLPADASEVVRERERVLRDAGVSEDDIAKQEASFCTAVFPNTVPTMYWSVVELFSRPDVLDAVRRELEANAVRRSDDDDDDDDDARVSVLDVAALKTRCPLLLSVLQETQRTRAVNAMVRKVMDDTVLDGRYLLKKGNFLQIPSQPLHLSTAHWGASAETFDPYRFVAAGASAGDVEKERAGGGSSSNSTSNSSSASSMFMPWGAAPHLCPARQFATTQIIMVLALLALRVELKPAARDGRWDREAPLVTGDLVTVLNPAREARLVVSVRDGGDGTWKLEMGDSRTKVPLASG